MTDISSEKLEEYARWYKIAAEEVDDPEIVGKRSLEQIKQDELISEKPGAEPWIMLSPQGKDSQFMKSSDWKNPNVWFRLNENEIEIGLAFNQKPKVKKFERIIVDLNEGAKESLNDALRNFDDSWYLSIEQRWKEGHWSASQRLRQGWEKKIDVSEIEDNVDEIVGLINKWKEEGEKREENNEDVFGGKTRS